jgi:hypothetical protein
VTAVYRLTLHNCMIGHTIKNTRTEVKWNTNLMQHCAGFISVEWLCRNKTCTALHQVDVSFDLCYDARKHKIKISSFVLHSIFQIKLNMKHSTCWKAIWVIILKCTSKILEASGAPVAGCMCGILRARQHEQTGSNRIWHADAITRGLNPALSRWTMATKVDRLEVSQPMTHATNLILAICAMWQLCSMNYGSVHMRFGTWSCIIS